LSFIGVPVINIILQFFIDRNDYKKMNELQSNYTNKERWTSYLELFYSENVSKNIFLNFDILGSGHDKDLDERALLVATRCLNDININNSILNKDIIKNSYSSIISFYQEFLKNINYWQNAPVWNKQSIEIATKDWFKFLGSQN